MSKRRGGFKAGANGDFPEEDTPTPGIRASTLGTAGYAPHGLRLRAAPAETVPEPHLVHAEASGPTDVYRALMVVNVPRSALYPDATTWGSFDLSQALSTVYARATAFLCAAVATATKSTQAGQMRVFAEVMLREKMALPVGFDSMDDVEPDYVQGKVFSPNNVMGYRLWFVFGLGVPDPEVVLRQQIFANQQTMRILPLPTVETKFMLCPIRDNEVREEALAARALTLTAKRRKPSAAPAAKRRAGADDAGSDGDEPAPDAGSDGEGPDPAVAAKMVESMLREQMYERPSTTKLAKLAARRVRYVGNLGDGVASVDGYLRDVVASTHYMSQTANVDEIRNRWGVAPRLAMPDAETVWLPTASDEGKAGAVQCWSFERSVLAFYDDVRENSVCTEQLTAAKYGLLDGELSFPLRHAVWELAAPMLAPIEFFGETMPWTARRFDAAVHQVIGQRRAQKAQEEAVAQTKAKERNAEGASMPADTSELRLQSSLASMNRSCIADDDPQRAVLKRAAAHMRNGGDKDKHEWQRRFDNENAQDELKSNYTAAPYMKPSDPGAVETEQLMATVIPAYREAGVKLDKAITAVGKLQAPPGVDAAVWRAATLCEIHRLFRIDVLAELLSIILHNIGVPEVHRRALERIHETGHLSDAYTPDWCRLPQMSVEANAMVALGSRLVAGINMMHGMLETMEYLAVQAVQATDPEPHDMVHTLQYGQKATGKSYNADRASEALLEGTVVRKDWQSAASSYTHSNDGNHVSFIDEGTEILTDQSREAHRRNAATLARTKQQLTSNKHPFERYQKEDGEPRSRVIRVMAHRPAVQTAFVNYIKISPGVDAALLDRMNVTAFAPSAMSHLMAVQRSHDSLSAERTAMWSEFCEQYKTEMAFKTILVLLARSRVIASVNTDVLKGMLAQALTDAVRFVPSFGESMRAAGRHEQFATALIFHTAFYTVLRSEASELLHWLGPGTSHTVLPAFLNDIATIFGPHLYARADHGCWMLTQMVRVGLPFIYYNVLRAVAAVHCNFRRAHMAIAYRRDGADLIDALMAERLASRDAEGQVAPDFVNELLRAEALLDFWVNQHSDQHADTMPRFRTIGEQQPRFDPNWMVLDGSVNEVASRITPLVQSYYKMDESQVSTMLMHAATIVVRVPIFAPIDVGAIKIGSIKFARDGVNNIASSPIRYQTVQMVRISTGTTPQVFISTGAMMIPPQMLLVLMLTASETTHTMPLQTVLPIEFGHNAQLMHTWRVSRRPGYNPVFVNHTAVTHSFVAMERRAVIAEPGDNRVAGLSTTVQSADTDMVRTAFYRHMRALHQMPPYAAVVAELVREAEFGLAQARAVQAANFGAGSDAYEAALQRLDAASSLQVDNPTAEQYERVFRAWADASPAAPGASAERRAWAYRASEALAAGVRSRLNFVHYPHTNALEQSAQTFMLSHAARVLPPIARRGKHRPIEAGVAAVSVGNSEDGREYAANRQQVRVIIHMLCTSYWFHIFKKYAASVEWRHLFEMLISIMWSPAEAEAYARTGQLPDQPQLITQEQSDELLRHSNLPFSVNLLRLLAEWLFFVRLTRRIGMALRRNPALSSIQHAYDSLLDDDNAVIELADDAAITGIRAISPDMAVDLSDQQLHFYQTYCASMDRLRPLRAARLAELMRRNEEAMVAESSALASSAAAGGQSSRNVSVSRLTSAPSYNRV